MDIDKIKEIISDLEREIKVQEEALRSLQNLLSTLNGKIPLPIQVAVSDNLEMTDSVKRILFRSDESYVDLAVKLIKASNRSLTVSEIAEQIRTLKNDPSIERRSVEATLYQHVSKAQSPRLTKVAPGTYGLTNIAA
jgi:hypothetical protein